MTQKSRLNGKYSEGVLDIRLATRAFYSMGHGCDVLVYLGETVPDCWRFGLQPGSLLLWDPSSHPRSHLMLPRGVVAYPVPFKILSIRNREELDGKGFAALGALLHLLGISEDTLHQWAASVSAPRSFASGVAFARDEIEKRDAYSIPSVRPDGRSRLLLSCEQAILLGYAVSQCQCRTGCDTELVTAPARWIAHHLSLAGSMVTLLESDGYPGTQVYRGPQGKVLALLRGNNSAIASCLKAFRSPTIFVAADIPDIIRLVKTGHHLIRNGMSDGVGVLIEDSLVSRQESIDTSTLADWIRARNSSEVESDVFVQSDAQTMMVEREGNAEAAIGFVAWGTAQGVVRDAVALCRSFGLNVAALYPKRIVPFHRDDIESFARTLGRVVIVESGGTQSYWNRLRPPFSCDYATLTPPQDQALTPMDIFLREGLGSV